MPSLTGLTKDLLLTQAIEYISSVMTDCGYSICSARRTHARPLKIDCCDCDGAAIGYTLIGWIERSFNATGLLLPAGPMDCPTLTATELGFTIARCWPVEDPMPKNGGKQDAAAGELDAVLECLTAALDRCAEQPSLFHNEPTDEVPEPPSQLCSKMWIGQFQSESSRDVTPYAVTGTVTSRCAGWSWSMTVA